MVRVREARWDRPQDRAALTRIRGEVFVAEQGVPVELELDGRDSACRHVLALVDGAPVGAARMQDSGHMGRIAVLAAHRGRGIGARLVAALIDAARDAGLSRVDLDSQVHAKGFYEKLGFVPHSGVFLEAGIEHQTMELTLDAPGPDR